MPRGRKKQDDFEQKRLENVKRLAEEQYKSFPKTHGLFYFSSTDYRGYWPCQIQEDGNVLSISENLM